MQKKKSREKEYLAERVRDLPEQAAKRQCERERENTQNRLITAERS